MSDQEGIIESLTRRVERLEQKNLSNFAYPTESPSGKTTWLLDKSLVDAICHKTNQRLSRLEELTAGAKPVTGSDGKRGVVIFEKDRPLDPVSLPDKDYKVWINPKASPSGIPFEVALAYLKQGRRIKLQSWQGGYLEKTQNGLTFRRGYDGAGQEFYANEHAMTSNEWMVIPEGPSKDNPVDAKTLANVMAAHTLVIEDGDMLVSDGSKYRTTQVALAIWSEGAIGPATNRPRMTWYQERGGSYRPLREGEALPPFIAEKPSK